jgi:hypothetical protein
VPDSRDATPSENPYPALRSTALDVGSDDVGITLSDEHPVWGLVMDVSLDENTYTLVAFRDDAVSIYLSTGGGFIGAGEHDAVRREATEMLDAAAGVLPSLVATESFPLPQRGYVRFYVRTFSGTLTGEVEESELVQGAHQLSRLFFAAQDVITAVREASAD